MSTLDRLLEELSRGPEKACRFTGDTASEKHSRTLLLEALLGDSYA